MRLVAAGALAGAPACGDSTPVGPPASPSISLDFEGSSLGSWSVSGDTLLLSLRQDTNASTRYWFAFQVEGAAGRDLVFRIPASENMYGPSGWQGKQPVATADGGATWSRIADAESTGGFFTFRYRPGTDADRVALTLPYTFSRWLDYRSAIVGDQRVRSAETIGRSLGGNPLHMLEVTSPLGSDQDKALVWAVARQHPGEPEGSHMMEGLINWLLGGSAEADALLESARVFLVPFLNPDGVLEGNQRVNQAGLDLNRQWVNPTPTTAPTILATALKMLELDAQGDGTRIVLDFHGAPPSRSNFFIYNDVASVPPDVFDEMQTLLNRAISLNPDFAPLQRSTARPVNQGERTRSWAYQFLGTHGLTIEASGVDTPDGPFAGQQMTEDRYHALGSAVGRAVGEVLFN